MPIYTYHCIAVLQNVCISDCMCLTNKPVHITRVNTVIQKVTLSYCGIYKFDRFYNIGHIVYRINLQHNNYWLPRLTYVLLKHLLKHVNLHSINFCRQSCTLPLHKIIKKISSLSTSTVCTWDEILQQVCKTFFLRPEVSYSVYQ